MGAPTEAPATQKVSSVISTFRPTRLFKAQNIHHTSLDFDDSGELLLLSRTDEKLHIYNTKAGAYAKELKSQKYGCALARFTHHSQSLIYASTKLDHGIRYLSTHNDSFIRYFRGHTEQVTSLSLCPSNDTFLSASLDNTVKLWDLKSSNPQGNLNLYGTTLTAYDPSATVIALASPATQSVLLYDLRNFDKPPFATFDLLEAEKRYAQQYASSWTSLEFSNNGKYILIGTAGHGHYVLDAFEGNLKAFCHRPAGPQPFPAEVSRDGSAMRHDANGLQGDCCFSPDGRYVVGASAQNGMVAWDMAQCDDPKVPESSAGHKVLTPVTDLPGPKTVTVVGYNPRYNMMASGGSDVMLWLPDPDLL